MLLISNKISINKNTLVLSGCFVVWLFCWLHCLCIQQNHKTTKQQNHNIKHWYFSLPHGSGDWGASFTYEGLVTKTNSHGWNFMKFHPNSTTNSTLFNVLILKVITFRRWKGGITFRKFIFQRIMTEKLWIYVNFHLFSIQLTQSDSP